MLQRAHVSSGSLAHFRLHRVFPPMPLLISRFAELDLIRQPEQQDEPLQAFDAADEYLLSHVAETGLSLDSRVLVLNDSFGAL
ncbi:Ribosomal RNA large subunit methyltransferase G, partial [Pseudomonas syringae pv. maculicola]